GMKGGLFSHHCRCTAILLRRRIADDLALRLPPRRRLGAPEPTALRVVFVLAALHDSWCSSSAATGRCGRPSCVSRTTSSGGCRSRSTCATRGLSPGGSSGSALLRSVLCPGRAHPPKLSAWPSPPRAPSPHPRRARGSAAAPPVGPS